MHHGLALSGPAFHVAGTAMLIYLRYMPLDRFPPGYLSAVFFAQTPPHVIPAIPLEPPARIFRIYPAFFTPVPERLAGIDLEIIHPGVVTLGTELRMFKPVLRKFFTAIRHIFAAKYPER